MSRTPTYNQLSSTELVQARIDQLTFDRQLRDEFQRKHHEESYLGCARPCCRKSPAVFIAFDVLARRDVVG